jgi:hypothetical protein
LQPSNILVDQILAITKDEDYLANPIKQAKVKEIERQIKGDISGIEGYATGIMSAKTD